jgi:lysophospholipase L1-like esterase
MKSPLNALIAVVAVVGLGAGTLHAQRGEKWVGTWATGGAWRPSGQPVPPAAPPIVPPVVQPAGIPAQPPARVQHFNNQTLRQVVHTSIGGSRVRLVLSNVFGTAPMQIGAASVGLREKDATLAAGSTRPLTFSTRPSVTIPAGAIVISDPVSLTFPAMADLAIDLFLPGNTESWPSALTMHNTGLQTNYVSPAGNHAGMAFTPEATITSWFLLARVEVMAPASTLTVVTVGDSITDGTRSTTDANRRWPDELTRRLQAKASTRGISVLNVGIGGNRLLSEGLSNFGINALARFDRDVLAQPGVTHVVVLEGINDIGMAARGSSTPSAEDLIGAHRQLVERAHTKGLKIFGATLTPFEGANYFTAEGEAKRQAVNEWLRTSKIYDAIIDFDAAVRDPQRPTKILAAYDSGDALHPSDAGYKAMAAAVDLALFK